MVGRRRERQRPRGGGCTIGSRKPAAYPSTPRLPVRPPLGERTADCRAAHGLLLDERAGGVEQLVEVDPVERGPELAHQGAFGDGGEQRAHGEVVARRGQVQGSAQEPAADRLAAREEVVELGGIEVPQPRPQAEVRRGRLLRLHRHEVLDRRGSRAPLAAQQELALQQRAVERAAVEDHGGAIVSVRARPGAAGDAGERQQQH
jgi:hypothetical protein